MSSTASPMKPNNAVHPIAFHFSKSASSGLYHQARPDYPSESLKQVFELLKSDNNTVVELGSGTGIFTKHLLTPAPEHFHKISHLTCVEPSEGMRETFAREILADRDSHEHVQLECCDGTFDCIPVQDGVVDLVCVAQAWHWTGDNTEACLAEIARKLKVGGYLALIWNLEDREAAEWVARCRDLYEQYEASSPQYRLGKWKRMFEDPSYIKHFSPNGEQPVYRGFARKLPTTVDQVVARCLSKSYMTALEEEKQKEIEKSIREILAEGHGVKWIDQEKGVFEYPYQTDLYILKRVQ